MGSREGGWGGTGNGDRRQKKEHRKINKTEERRRKDGRKETEEGT